MSIHDSSTWFFQNIAWDAYNRILAALWKLGIEAYLRKKDRKTGTMLVSLALNRMRFCQVRNFLILWSKREEHICFFLIRHYKTYILTHYQNIQAELSNHLIIFVWTQIPNVKLFLKKKPAPRPEAESIFIHFNETRHFLYVSIEPENTEPEVFVQRFGSPLVSPLWKRTTDILMAFRFYLFIFKWNRAWRCFP